MREASPGVVSPHPATSPHPLTPPPAEPRGPPPHISDPAWDRGRFRRFFVWELGGTRPPKVRAAAQLPRVTFPLCALPAPPPALDALPGGRVSVRIVLAVFRLPFPRHKVMRRSSQERIPFPVCTSRARVRSHQQIWAGLGALVARS